MFWEIFGVLVAACVAVRFFSRDTSQTSAVEKTAEFSAFQRNFLIIYYVVMCADWLQGPYVYALYEQYGFQKGEIAFLFIGGFMSSMVFGTFVGALADKYGRKLLCIMFGVFYSISCLTKLFNNFGILMLGRVLSGIATSLLFSSFESWMVTEHKSRNFPNELLSDTFSLATFGNGIVAIGAGIVASLVADNFGFVAPFMVSLVLLIVGSIIVSSSWKENYGDSNVDISGTFVNAWQGMKQDIKIPILGLVQSLFEAAMYTFVFMWTPALQAAIPEGSPKELPFGIIFACYMVSIMIGSSIFGILLRYKFSPEEIARMLLLTAAVSLLVPIYVSDMLFVTLSFLLFEICCGVYFPCMGTLRGKYIPEETRAATMNFFRVPLNFLVVLVLVKVNDLNNSTVFIMCSMWLFIAFLLQNQLKRLAISATKDEDASVSKPVPVSGH